MEETKEKDKTTGVVYISDNDNMFIAPEGISEEERKRLSLEVDRDLLKKKLEEIEAELEGLPETEAEQPKPPKEKKEEIERVQPYEFYSTYQKRAETLLRNESRNAGRREEQILSC